MINLAGGELEFARKYIRGFDFNVWLADRNRSYVVTSPAVNVIRIADKDDPNNTTEDITLDPVTWLPVKSASVSLADPAHPVPSETRFEEWQVVQGIHFPRRIANYHSGARLAEITVEHLELNKGLKADELAAKPPDMNPVIPDQ